MSDEEKPNMIEEARKRLAELEADLPPLREIPEGIELNEADADLYRRGRARIVGGFIGAMSVIAAPDGMSQEEFDRHRANAAARQRAIEANRKAEKLKARPKTKKAIAADKAMAEAQKLIAPGYSETKAFRTAEKKNGLASGTLKRKKNREKNRRK